MIVEVFFILFLGFESGFRNNNEKVLVHRLFDLDNISLGRKQRLVLE